MVVHPADHPTVAFLTQPKSNGAHIHDGGHFAPENFQKYGDRSLSTDIMTYVLTSSFCGALKIIGNAG